MQVMREPFLYLSHPVRGAWIETCWEECCRPYRAASHPVRGAWIETWSMNKYLCWSLSHPVRGAWIETACITDLTLTRAVAPREGCVD